VNVNDFSQLNSSTKTALDETHKGYKLEMKKLITALFFFHSLNVHAEADKEYCSHWFSWFKPVCQRLHQVLDEGANELYISGYAWHNRYIYTPEKINQYNEAAWGGGLGKGLFDEKGNWHGLFAFAFLDSHKNIEPIAGYAYLKVGTVHKDLKIGLGGAVLVTARPDINNGVPFPGALPWLSIFYKKATLGATYIPGFNTNGNVLYLLVKYTF
jgi:palmitoyl transferase